MVGPRVLEMLEEAAVFERADDFDGAIARVRDAVQVAGEDADARTEVALALGRIHAREREWREELDRREASFFERERAEAGPSPPGVIERSRDLTRRRTT